METIIEQMMKTSVENINESDVEEFDEKNKSGYKEASDTVVTEAATKRIKNEEVRDGYLNDLPEALRVTVMDVHKLIATTARNEFSKNKYNYLNTQKWAKEWLDQFLTEPTGNSAVGSVRLYKKGKRYRCMIQMTEHVENKRNTEDEEFFHGFIRNVHTAVRAKVRRQFDLTLTCESEHGEPFEGFDVWTKQKTAKELWNLFEDKKIKHIKESADNVEYMVLGLNELPFGLQESINEAYRLIIEAYADDSYCENCCAVLRRDTDGSVEGSVSLTQEMTELDEESTENFKAVWENAHTVFENNNPTKTLNLHSDDSLYFEIGLDPTYAEMMWDCLEENVYADDESDVEEFDERSHSLLKSAFRIGINPENGHIVKIVFDLNPKEITLVGSHLQKEMSDSKEERLAREARAKGLTDFSSISMVKGIVDMDTKQQLNQVTAVGIIGQGLSRYVIPNSLVDKNLPEDARFDFSSYPVKTREKIAQMQDFRNAPDAITYVVGKYEPVTSYKSTRAVNSKSDIGDYMALKQSRGVEIKNPGKKQRFKVAGYGYTNMHIKTAVNELRKEIDDLKPLVDRANDKDTTDDLEAAERSLESLKKAVAANEGENWAQVASDERYREPYDTVKDQIKLIRMDLRGKGLLPSIKRIKKESVDVSKEVIWDPFEESEEYNVTMSEAEAKRTLRTLSQQIINSSSSEKITQYTVSTYANVITKSLLPIWAKGYNKFSIILAKDSDTSTVEFKVPKMTQDFVSRFIEGRETIDGLLHRTPEIKIKISPKVFLTMKNPDDAYNFFKAAIKYYDRGIDTYTGKLMSTFNGVSKELKQLISTTKLSGLVTMPIQMLLVFTDVDMSSRDVFKIKNEDINAVKGFIKGIYANYESPEKQKSRILKDLNSIVCELKECCEYDYNLKTCIQLVEGVTDLYDGKFDEVIRESKQRLYDEAVDKDWTYRSTDAQTVYIQEKFGVKKLKKFPSNLVAYITIETEAIMTYDQKEMVASYCLSKIDLVEWYIELIDSQSKKYVVPHSRPYLVNLHEQLLKCYKNIMAVDVEERQRRRQQSTSQYTGPAGIPKGYEG